MELPEELRAGVFTSIVFSSTTAPVVTSIILICVVPGSGKKIYTASPGAKLVLTVPNWSVTTGAAAAEIAKT